MAAPSKVVHRKVFKETTKMGIGRVRRVAGRLRRSVSPDDNKGHTGRLYGK